MPPRLLTCCLARNEASRFLPSALAVWSQFADEILLLDDASTDNTAQLAIDAGCIVHYRDGRAWGNEAPARQQLFDLAMSNTEYGDWILVCDADMTPADDPRELAFGGHSSAWAMPCLDLWEPNRYRVDGYWQYGLGNPRIWLIRRPTPTEWLWPERGVHCGHIPLNLTFERGVGVAPIEYGYLHYGWSRPELREAKVKQYLSIGNQLTAFERSHALSALDANPTLVPLSFEPRFQLEYEGDKMQEAA